MRLVTLLIAPLLLAAALFPPAVAAATPSNDDFATATTIAANPFHDSVGIADATSEAGETNAGYVPGRSVWYRLNPPTDGSVAAQGSGDQFTPLVNVYSEGTRGTSRRFRCWPRALRARRSPHTW